MGGCTSKTENTTFSSMETNKTTQQTAETNATGKGSVYNKPQKDTQTHTQNSTSHIDPVHSDIVFDICFTNDPRIVVSCGEDRTIAVWNWKTGKILHKW